MRLLAVLALAACTSLAALDGGGREPGSDPKWAMRWRVYCSTADGIAFRYPYTYFPVDQYKGELNRQRGWGGGMGGGAVVVTKDGKAIIVPEGKGEGERLDCDVRAFSFAEADLGEAQTPEALGDREAKAKLEWKPFDYYRSDPQRPHADAKWAADGITAALGTGKDRCCLVVSHEGRRSGLVLTGQITGDNQRIIDSFEVLATGIKPKPGEKPKADAKKSRAMTWREAQVRQGFAFTAEGKAVKQGSAKVAAAPWKDAWEVETEHYHIMGNLAPGRLLQHAVYYEALYRAYSKVYAPERMPPYKFEVHAFNLQDEFVQASNSWGHPIQSTRAGGVMGFFVPSLLSLWVFEESRLIRESTSIEHVSAHECSHQFLHVACNGSDHVPTWINEGLAVYFENGVFKDGEFQIRMPDRVSELKAQYSQKKDTLWPLENYLEHGGHISADMYAEVFAMTHFWVFGSCKAKCKHEGCGLKLFRDYWSALKAKEDGGKAFERIFMDAMIKAKGGREAALKAWRDALLTYVVKELR